MSQKHTKTLKVMLSGGGTGGHIYPGVAIAEQLQKKVPDSQLLFVGATGKMEMEKVPKAGYPIEGLPIRGLQRKLSAENLKLPFRLLRSLWKADQLIRRFRPEVIVGTGGYASAAVGWVGAQHGIPLLIQEQNNYAGLTNKILSRHARKICVAYPDMETHFPPEKLALTGNPLRQTIQSRGLSRVEGARHFNLDPNKKIVLVMGGSGGAKTLNQALLQQVRQVLEAGHQLIWQTGSYYYQSVKAEVTARGLAAPALLLRDFIYNMPAAYACADLVVCRAGALTIAELSLLGLPTLLVPSPNVTDDHQTKNARALSSRQAAVLLPDAEARQGLIPELLRLLEQDELRAQLAKNIQEFAFPDAASAVADLVLELAGRK